MKKYDPLWKDLNNLLSMLSSPMPNNVVEIVRQYYAQFNNDAPPSILKSYVERLQNHLNEAEDEHD